MPQTNITLKNVAAVTASPKNKASGLIDELYFAPLSDFNVVGTVDAAETDIYKRGLVKTAHTFNSPKGFVKISDMLHGTCKYSHSPSGEKGFAMQKCMLEGQSLGQNPNLVGVCNQLQFQPGIALGKKQDGTVVQVGSADFPAYLKFEYDSNVSDAAQPHGIKVTIESTQPEVLTYDYPTLAITVIS